MNTSHRVGCPALRDESDGCLCHEGPISPSASLLYQRIAQVRRDLQNDPDVPVDVLRTMLLRSLEGMEILSQCVDQLKYILGGFMERSERHGRP